MCNVYNLVVLLKLICNIFLKFLRNTPTETVMSQLMEDQWIHSNKEALSDECAVRYSDISSECFHSYAI